MRFVALLRFSNFFTDFRSSNGATPAKLFHVSTSRLMGHSAVTFVNSFSVANATSPSCAAGAASSAVMLLCVSIGNDRVLGLLHVREPAGLPGGGGLGVAGRVSSGAGRRSPPGPPGTGRRCRVPKP